MTRKEKTIRTTRRIVALTRRAFSPAERGLSTLVCSPASSIKIQRQQNESCEQDKPAVGKVRRNGPEALVDMSLNKGSWSRSRKTVWIEPLEQHRLLR